VLKNTQVRCKLSQKSCLNYQWKHTAERVPAEDGRL
jgi:hypothetical protein